MKKGWEIKSLGEIADVEYGFTDKSTEEGDYRYVRITDIDNNGELVSSDKKYLKHSKEAEAFLIRDNDLLMARTGATFAKVLLYEDIEPSVFASYLIKIKFKEKIENKLYWYFTKTKSYWDQANSLASGAAQPHFNGAAVKQVIFSYPKSLPEQRRIVAILDEAFAAIAKAKANAEQNLKNAKELFESYLQGVFENKGEGWEEKSLGKVCNIKHGFAFQGKYFSDKGDYVLLTPGNFFEEGGYRNRGDKQKYYVGEIPQEFILKKGDLLVAMTEQAAGLLGSPILVPESNLFLHNQRLGLVTSKSGVEWSNDFFYHVFNLPFVRKNIHDSGTGVKVRHTSPTKIGDVVVAFPKSLKTQQSIVKKLDTLFTETKKLEAIYQQKINDLEELKKSLLQKAFAGELKTVRSIA